MFVHWIQAVSCRDAKDVDDFLQLTEEDGKVCYYLRVNNDTDYG